MTKFKAMSCTFRVYGVAFGTPILPRVPNTKEDKRKTIYGNNIYRGLSNYLY